MRKRSFIFSALLLLLLSLTVSAAVAQELCEALVRDAWEEVKGNCSAFDTLNACYGFDSLDATFNQPVDNKAFSKPSDVIQLPELQTIHTLPFDSEAEEWGVSDFRIDATAFGGEQGQSIIIFTTGDTIVENVVEPGGDLQPMQAFNFKTAGKSDCKDAPNAVFIQAPKGLKVNLVVNSTPIQLGSTIVLSTENSDDGHDQMVFGVIEGSLTINPGAPEAQVVHQGEFTTTTLSDDKGQGLNGEQKLNGQLVPVLNPLTGEPVIGPGGEPFYRQIPVEDFTPAEPITNDGEGLGGWDAYRFLTFVPATLLNYAVEVPEPEVVSNTTNTNNPVVKPKPTATPAGNSAANWCDPGGIWGDGRCNDPDPALAAWYWNAGWYNEQYELGNIPYVPDSYLPIPVNMQCYLQIGGNEFEIASSSVYNGGNGGNFVWSGPDTLINTVYNWLIWQSGVWHVGHYGNCGPLGVFDPYPNEPGYVVIN